MLRKPFGTRISWALCLVAAAYLYAPVVVRLAEDWLTDDNYSHGLLVIPLAAFFAWERRAKVQAARRAPSSWGLPVVVAGLAMFLVGQLGAEIFLPRVSIIVTLVGGVLFAAGWQVLRQLAFPIAFLILMIPLPALIFNQIAFPLQLFASQVGEAGLRIASIPVLREGNVIVLANTSLEVAEACSGIRSLISLLTFGIVYGYFTGGRPAMVGAIALSTVPVAVVANGLRVADTGVAAHFWGGEAATGFLHTFSGWLMFIAAAAMVVAVAAVLHRIWPGQTAAGPVNAPAEVAT